MRSYSTRAVPGTAARLVALVALLGFQLAYAGHENQHAAGEHTQACAACAHLNQNTPAAPDAAPDVPGPAADAAPRVPAVAGPVPAERRAYTIRGPPCC